MRGDLDLIHQIRRCPPHHHLTANVHRICKSKPDLVELMYIVGTANDVGQLNSVSSATISFIAAIAYLRRIRSDRFVPAKSSRQDLRDFRRIHDYSITASCTYCPDATSGFVFVTENAKPSEKILEFVKFEIQKA